MKKTSSHALIALLTLSAADGYAQNPNPALNDGQILQIVRTLNDGEIKQAEAAIDKSETDRVKQTAEMIITDHEDSNEQLNSLLKDALELEDSALNKSLASEAAQTLQSLQKLTDTQFDCAYLQAQVAQHQTAIDTAKNALIPQAKDAAVNQFLVAMGPKLEHHLEMAKAAVNATPACSK